VVELGILSLGDVQRDQRTGRLHRPVDRMAAILGYAVLADQLGLEVFAVGEHHSAEFFTSSPAVVLAAVAASGLQGGDWRLCECTGWPDNPSWQQLIAWCWSSDDAHNLVVVNYAGQPAQARVHLPWSELSGMEWQLTDRLTGAQFTRGGDEMAADGLYIGLDPWAAHFLTFAAGQGSTDTDGEHRA